MTSRTTRIRRFRQSFLAASLFASFAGLASGATTVTNPTSDTTWTAAGSPYTLTANITVPAGVTLTIGPGVQVLADSAGGLDIDGALVAQGTLAAPITFTRSGASGKWKGLSVTGTAAAPGSASLAYVNVSHGGSCTYCADLYVENSTTVTVANSTFTDSGTHGIYAYSGSVDVSDSSFTNNVLNAIRYDSGAANPVLARLTATGNGTDAVSTGSGTMTGDHVWEAMGLPYVVTGSLTLATGGSLTISPGVEVRFSASNNGLTINGTLTAVATPSTPITLTGLTATAGSWQGVQVLGGSATFDSVSIAYGGFCTYCADLYVQGATVQVTRSSFSNSATDGIYVYSGNANVSQSSFANNARYAIQYGRAESNPVLAGLTATGNGTDAVAMGSGTMSGAHIWEANGIPSYVVTGSQTLATGATLTIQPGVQVSFMPGAGLMVSPQGTLNAVGLPAAPISLTGTSAAAGSWQGLKVYGSATLDFVTMAGGGICTYCADLYVDGATAQAQVTRSSFLNSGTDGIYVYSGIANVSDSSFTNNTRYAIQYQSATANPILSNLIATGNGTNAVAIGGGTMTGAHVWEATGIPYVVTGSPSVAAGSSLTIEPGVQVTFAATTRMFVSGSLRASGTAALPISLTGVVASPGSWQGLMIGGPPSAPASATFDYVTLKHGGGSCTYCANLYIEYGRVQITHSTISDSSKNGIWQYYGSGSSIETSQIVSNAGYGVDNEQTSSTSAVQATNNWWGSPSGPISTCVSGGAGSSVRGAVAVSPYLTAPDGDPGPVAPGDMAILSITPQRWFVPADNVTRLFVKLSIRNGNGQPLPGQVLRLSSTVGSVVDGGTTDVNGSTFAYVSSSTPGDAILTATTDVATVCAFARSQPSTVTFTSIDSNPLRPDIEAPYMDGGIQITPEPITRGVLTKVSAKLHNKNAFPISVDASLGFAQSGIGLTFGPLGEVLGKIIPANSDGTIEVQWTPVVSGHYCMQLQYSAVSAASAPLVRTSSVTTLAGAGAGRSQRNLNVYGGGLGDKNEKDSLNKADKAFKLVSKVPSGPTQVQKWLLGRWWDWVKDTASDISKNLGGDPPRLDYKIIALPDAKPILAVTTPDPDVSAARIAAMNALNDALLNIVVQGRAAIVSLDRAGGAAQANDLLWNSQQTAAILEYKKQLGNALILAADKTDAFLLVLTNEGVTSIPTSLADAQTYQARLSTQGFTADEINDAHALGYTDAQIAARLLEITSTDPTTLMGDMIPRLASESTTMRTLGNALIHPQNFPTLSISGGLTAHNVRGLATTNPNHLARIFPSVSTVEIGNPTATLATIDLRARVVDLPADWTVTLNPSSVDLNAGEQTTVTVTITPGSPVPQGIKPRIAVEGYIGTTLLGGVAVDVIVPTAVPFRMSISGDANGDGDVTVSDIFYEINNLFAGGPAPVAGDANGDGAVTVADVFYMINYLFAAGPPPI